MGHVENSVMDYLKSHELQASQSSVHKAIEISVKHGKDEIIIGVSLSKPHSDIFIVHFSDIL